MIDFNNEASLDLLKETNNEIENLKKQELPFLEFKRKVDKIIFNSLLKLKKMRNCNSIKKSHKRNYYHGNI